MTDSDSPLRWDGEDLVVQLHVQPKASRDEIVGMQDGALKVKVTAAPVEGKANDRLMALLGQAFGVAKSRIKLEAGAGSRLKRVRITKPSRIPPQLLNIL